MIQSRSIPGGIAYHDGITLAIAYNSGQYAIKTKTLNGTIKLTGDDIRTWCRIIRELNR